jgi:predicted outer membrane lipoprotein
MTRPISVPGFLLGALLAATAALVKIVFLEEIEERRDARAA